MKQRLLALMRQIAASPALAEVRRRLLVMAVAVDQCLWCLLTFGYYGPDETLSACAHRWVITGKRTWPRNLIDCLFWLLESDHCFKAFMAELKRTQLPKEYSDARADARV